MSDVITLTALTGCVSRRWTPGIGDPSVMGWVTVTAYGAAAVLSLACVPRAHRWREPLFWAFCALLMAGLAINKQLDLQSALTAVGRCLSQAQGWYDQRRAVQKNFVLILLACAALSAPCLIWIFHRILRRTWLALLGMLIVATFVTVRAVSFHHIDAILNLRIQTVRVNWILELSGITLIAANALSLILRPRERDR
ncbi:MAG: isopropylmalate isomerase [Qingshengfaniella sp.]